MVMGQGKVKSLISWCFESLIRTILVLHSNGYNLTHLGRAVVGLPSHSSLFLQIASVLLLD